MALSKLQLIRQVLPYFKENLKKCSLCPRKCKVNRLQGELGFCQIGLLPQVASYDLHFGEESPLVGKGGSGTIFFAHCNLGCVFCQNHSISNNQSSFPELYPNQLAYIMLTLQEKGAENINLVTPSHVLYPILKATEIALESGLNLPLVYNTSSYDSLESLLKLKGIIDIYLADIKFFSSHFSQKYCQAKNYPQVAKENILEMYNQVGGFKEKQGIAYKGLMLRHLILPNNLGETEKWLNFLAENKMYDVYLNLMDQYYPCHLAYQYKELNKTISYEEFEKYYNLAQKMGFKYIDKGSKRLFKLLFKD